MCKSLGDCINRWVDSIHDGFTADATSMAGKPITWAMINTNLGFSRQSLSLFGRQLGGFESIALVRVDSGRKEQQQCRQLGSHV